MNIIHVFSQNDFEKKLRDLGLNNSNVNESDCAFIQIIGTPECRQYYLNDDRRHYFVNCDSPNVLNLEFDDIDGDSITWKGHIFKGINEEQAKQCVEFIEKNKGKNFFISCRAGKSRSQGVCRYILDMYGNEYGYDETKSCRKDNPCLTPNIRVVTMLKREFYKLNGYNLEN